MSVDFETATAALFARLQQISGFAYTTRVLEDWDSTPPAQQPALMLTSGAIAEFTPNVNLVGQTPALWKAQLLVLIYVQAPDRHMPSSSLLNPLIADVVNALQRQAGEVMNVAARFPSLPGQFMTTLGGLCAYCRAYGQIERSEGIVGHVAAASIPIEMVLTS